jgi:hypothetical protein
LPAAEKRVIEAIKLYLEVAHDKGFPVVEQQLVGVHRVLMEGRRSYLFTRANN